MMPEPFDPHAPFERCGYTVQHSEHLFDRSRAVVRVGKGDWVTYLEPSFYAEFDGDDEAFASVMDAMLQQAQYERDVQEKIASLPDATITLGGIFPAPEA